MIPDTDNVNALPTDLLIEILASPARGALEALAAANEPFTNQLVFEDDGKISLALYEGGYEQFVMSLALLLSEHCPKWIAHIADTWELRTDREKPTSTQLEAIRRHMEEGVNLGVLFDEGHPDVVEALTVILARPNVLAPEGVELTAYSLPYDREDDGEITWGEPIPKGAEVGGICGDTLRLAVKSTLPGAMFRCSCPDRDGITTHQPGCPIFKAAAK